ncbi:MAG TPA: cytochrome c [Crocinitomix sp.]|nr:cytochrome c [Crocinitomix sp.]
MKLLSFFALHVLCFTSVAQTTWSEHAATVLYNNCTSCHNPNGIAPNSLMTYTQASNYAPLILNYVSNGIMPPWTADTAYQHYSGERVLTQQEKNILINWVNDGALEGDPTMAPPPPIYNGSQQLPGVPDLVIQAPNYMSKATPFSDDYVCFVIPSGLVQDKKVKSH